ncbi:aspartate kinase [Eubacteriales bacterium OttesenSCG-928-G02]|nr:aspartate kinase [Eubacteriales bacterium OttesenSCG-928-G02]
MVSINNKKIVKFGGTSLASAEQFKKVGDIIFADTSRRFVVPSAPGKRYPSDIKVTDMLIECQSLSASGDDFLPVLNKIKERFEQIREQLNLNITLEHEFKTIENNLKNGCTRDYMASRGEYLNGILLANFLGYEFVDAAEIIFFTENGLFDAEKTNKIASERLNSLKNAVIPGFYGALPNGEVKTFSRGGSDVTGAIIARAVMADVYENWTDVSGFLMCDPRIVENPRAIKSITYRELRELSYMGAGVLHEDSIFPVKQAGIPINIKNTNAPDDEGTYILPTALKDEKKNRITGIAGHKGFAVLHIEKDMMNQEIGFGLKVLEVLNKLNMSFEHFPSGIDTMSIIINEKFIEGNEKILLSEISKAVNPDNISIETGLALIAVVGRGMIKYPGTAAKIFTSIANSDINIRMIDQGSSELNIIIGVDEKDFEKAIKAIYNEFVPA